MQGPITWAQLAVFCTFGGVLVGAIVWGATLIANLKLQNRLDDGLQELLRRIPKEKEE